VVQRQAGAGVDPSQALPGPLRSDVFDSVVAATDLLLVRGNPLEDLAHLSASDLLLAYGVRGN